MELADSVEVELRDQGARGKGAYWEGYWRPLPVMIEHGINVCGEDASVTTIADWIIETYDMYVREVTEP
jgi:hypothetical protein